MRWLRREKTPRVFADYGGVSERVHARRAARESDPEPYRTDPAEAALAVRSYAPEARIRDLAKTAQRLVDDVRDIPRTHGPERTPEPECFVMPPLASLLALNVCVIGLAAGYAAREIADGWASVAFVFFATYVAAVPLLFGIVDRWEKESRLARVCLVIAGVQMAAGFWCFAAVFA